MQVRTLFFASYRDLVGTSKLDIEVPDGSTVGQLVGQLRASGRPYDGMPKDPAVAVNRSYAEPDCVLESGDEVAFIPPVAGG